MTITLSQPCPASGNYVDMGSINRKPNPEGKRFQEKWTTSCHGCHRNVGVYQDGRRRQQIVKHRQFAHSLESLSDAYAILSHLLKEGSLGSPEGVISQYCDIIGIQDFRHTHDNFKKYWDAADDGLDPENRHIAACMAQRRDWDRYHACKAALHDIAKAKGANIDFDFKQNQYIVLQKDTQVLEGMYRAIGQLRSDAVGHDKRFMAVPGISPVAGNVWPSYTEPLQGTAISHRVSMAERDILLQRQLAASPELIPSGPLINSGN